MFADDIIARDHVIYWPIILGTIYDSQVNETRLVGKTALLLEVILKLSLPTIQSASLVIVFIMAAKVNDLEP